MKADNDTGAKSNKKGDSKSDREELDDKVSSDSDSGANANTDPLSIAETAISELKDQNLRLAAEMDNLRRRTEKEIHDIRQYAVSSFARDILQVGDNLVRALETISDEVRAKMDKNAVSFLEGVEMTERELQNLLAKHGISKIEPNGEKFDPNFHQAMFEVTDSDAPSNTVVQVVQAGYRIGERVLRPALVGVAKSADK